MCGVEQCVTPETKLDMLRERMAGNKDAGADLRRKEQEYLSLLAVKVRPPLLCLPVASRQNVSFVILAWPPLTWQP